MRLVWRLVSVILFFCVVLVLLSKSLFPLLSPRSNHLLWFSFFNTLIFAIISGSHWPSVDEAIEAMGFFQSFHELGNNSSQDIEKTDDNNNDDDYDDDNDDDDDSYEGNAPSDGYYEDEDDDDDDDIDDVTDDSSTDEYVRGDEDYDDNLKNRIEDFIAKVTNEWKEERLREENGMKKSPPTG